MARLGETKITQVVLGEARITLIGPAPRAVGRFTYMGDDGTTYGSTILSMYSSRTWKLIQALQRSMEQDLVDALEPREPGPEEEVEEPGESNAFDENPGFSLGEDEQR